MHLKFGDIEVHRRKCRATGKVSFSRKVEAQYVMYKFKWFFSHPPRRPDGSRVKRRQRKKPKQQRIYYCEYCQGYHLTRLFLREYLRSKALEEEY